MAGHLGLMLLCSQSFLVKAEEVQEKDTQMQFIDIFYSYLFQMRNLATADQIAGCLHQEGIFLDAKKLMEYTEEYIGKESDGMNARARFFNGQLDPIGMAYPQEAPDIARTSMLPARRPCAPYKNPICWKRKSLLLLETCEYCCSGFEHKTGRGAPWCFDDVWTYDLCCNKDFEGLVCSEERKGEEGGCVDCKKTVVYRCLSPPEHDLHQATTKYNENLDKLREMEKSITNANEEIRKQIILLSEKDHIYQGAHSEAERRKNILARVILNRTHEILTRDTEREKRVLSELAAERLATEKTRNELSRVHSDARMRLDRGKNERIAGEHLVQRNVSAVAELNATLAADVENTRRATETLAAQEAMLARLREELARATTRLREAKEAMTQTQSMLEQEIARNGKSFTAANATYTESSARVDAAQRALLNVQEQLALQEKAKQNATAVETQAQNVLRGKKQTLENALEVQRKHSRHVTELEQKERELAAQHDMERKQHSEIEENLRRNASDRTAMACLLRNDTIHMEKSAPCEDKEKSCTEWANAGECGSNPRYMMKACMRSCGCMHKEPPAIVEQKNVLENALSAARAGMDKRNATLAQLTLRQEDSQRLITARNATQAGVQRALVDVANATDSMQRANASASAAREAVTATEAHTANITRTLDETEAGLPAAQSAVTAADQRWEAQEVAEKRQRRMLQEAETMVARRKKEEHEKKKKMELMKTRHAYYEDEIAKIELRMKANVRDAVEHYLKDSWLGFATMLVLGSFDLAGKIAEALGLSDNEAFIVSELLRTMKARDAVAVDIETARSNLVSLTPVTETLTIKQLELQQEQTRSARVLAEKASAQNAVLLTRELIASLDASRLTALEAEQVAQSTLNVRLQEVVDAARLVKEAEMRYSDALTADTEAEANASAAVELVKATKQIDDEALVEAKTLEQQAAAQETQLRVLFDQQRLLRDSAADAARMAALQSHCHAAEVDVRVFLSEEKMWQTALDRIKGVEATLANVTAQRIAAQRQHEDSEDTVVEARDGVAAAEAELTRCTQLRKAADDRVVEHHKGVQEHEARHAATVGEQSTAWASVKEVGSRRLTLEEEALNRTMEHHLGATAVQNITMDEQAQVEQSALAKTTKEQSIKQETNTRDNLLPPARTALARSEQVFANLLVQLQLDVRTEEERVAMQELDDGIEAYKADAAREKTQDARWRRAVEKLAKVDREQETKRKEDEKRAADQRFNSAFAEVEKVNIKLEEMEKDLKESQEKKVEKAKEVEDWFEKYLAAEKAHAKQDPKERERSFSWALQGSGADPDKR
eukprot:GEMP01001874.1.p1 GENE.GEMP01001874.1~~GEMP01001874.1.p1  ORF type:complete len:1435 (+),score=499.75 GEMP01001874.1:385-4305(+)